MDHLPNIGDRVTFIGDDDQPELARAGIVVGYGFQLVDNLAVVVLEHPEPIVLVLVDRAIDVPGMAIRVVAVHPANMEPA